jgi:hypothetical protein
MRDEPCSLTATHDEDELPAHAWITEPSKAFIKTDEMLAQEPPQIYGHVIVPVTRSRERS